MKKNASCKLSVTSTLQFLAEYLCLCLSFLPVARAICFLGRVCRMMWHSTNSVGTAPSATWKLNSDSAGHIWLQSAIFACELSVFFFFFPIFKRHSYIRKAATDIPTDYICQSLKIKNAKRERETKQKQLKGTTKKTNKQADRNRKRQKPTKQNNQLMPIDFKTNPSMAWYSVNHGLCTMSVRLMHVAKNDNNTQQTASSQNP